MLRSAETFPGFVRHGGALPCSPLVVSIPHAGRYYPPELLRAARLPRDVLALLEDGFADLLIGAMPPGHATVLIANVARAWIDLNRHEHELDQAMIVQPLPPERLVASLKVRGGLGLIPRRIAGAGEVWRTRLDEADIAARVATLHRPWHRAIADALAAARARFGWALLVDLHSMPPLPPKAGGAAEIVLGDLHGRASAPPLVEAMHRAAANHGLRVARNQPYAGGHTLDRHAAPPHGIHAIQIEIDRALYLDRRLRQPGTGLARMTRVVADMTAAALSAGTALAESPPLAAE